MEISNSEDDCILIDLSSEYISVKDDGKKVFMSAKNSDPQGKYREIVSNKLEHVHGSHRLNYKFIQKFFPNEKLLPGDLIGFKFQPRCIYPECFFIIDGSTSAEFWENSSGTFGENYLPKTLVRLLKQKGLLGKDVVKYYRLPFTFSEYGSPVSVIWK